jgi:hypothetical protein
MAVLNVPKQAITEVTENPYPNVRFSINTNLSVNQKAGGLLAKVQLSHPAVKCVVDVWKRGNRIYVTEPSNKSVNARGNTQFFAHFVLNDSLKQYICHIAEDRVLNGTHDTPWYLDMVGTQTITVTNEVSNPELGIEKIEPIVNMTNNQIEKGMVCKVTLNLDIGKFYGYTVWNSIFDRSLYGNAPQTDSSSAQQGEERDRSRNSPAFRLSEPATAQVLSFLHPQVDFEAEAQKTAAPTDVTEAVNTVKKAMEKAVAAKGLQTAEGQALGIDD